MYEIICFSPTVIYKSKMDYGGEMGSLLDGLEYVRYGANNGFHSRNFYILSESIFLEISQKIRLHVEGYLRSVLKIVDVVKFEFTTSWISKHEPGDFSQNHYHKNSVFSGVVYLKIPSNGGNLFFGKRNNNFPELLGIELSELNILNCDFWSCTPEEGDIFLFPSSLSHYTGVNESSENRYCLAFNLFPVGKLSEGIRELVIGR